MTDPDRLDVDARFLLANERTLLAWVRTALTLLAAGFAVQQLAPDEVARRPLAVALLLAGTLSALAGGWRYRGADAAIRSGRLPSSGRSPYLLVGLVVVLGAAATGALLL